MSTLDSHERYAEDAAAFVLGALTDAERTGFEQHLAGCARCREDVRALERAVAALPASVPQRRAPAEVKARVMATVNSEAALRNPRREEPTPRRRSPLRHGLRRLAPLAGLATAAVVATVVALVLSGSGGSHTEVIRAQVAFPHASVSVRVSDRRAELDVNGLPPSAPGHVYEVWIKREGPAEPADALFTVGAAGRAKVALPRSVAGVRQIMVTSEPSGGSPAPTGKPVIVASL